MRGCSKQKYERNFLHETVNLRWERYCKAQGLAVYAETPKGLMTDVHHSYSHQLRDGSCILQTSSLPYWHLQDRTLCPLEYFLQNGWDEADLGWDTCNLHVESWPEQDEVRQKKAPADGPSDGQPPQKRQRPRKTQHGPKIINLASNSMGLPELMSICYTSFLSSDTDLFQIAPDFAWKFNHGEAYKVVVDQHESARDIRRRLNQPGGEDASDEVESEDEFAGLDDNVMVE